MVSAKLVNGGKPDGVSYTINRYIFTLTRIGPLIHIVHHLDGNVMTISEHLYHMETSGRFMSVNHLQLLRIPKYLNPLRKFA